MLRAETLWVETFTGLRMDRFVKLVKVVRERGGNGPGGDRPWALPLAERVLWVAVYYRTNLTMRRLAPLFGVCPATVCRDIHRLRPLPALEPTPRPLADTGRLWIVDGTPAPVRDRGVGASSRNYRLSANVQVIIDADARLVIATARPAPGNKGDAHAWRESGLPAISAGFTVLADGAYWSTGLVVPHRKRANRPLLRGQEEDNTVPRRRSTRRRRGSGSSRPGYGGRPTCCCGSRPRPGSASTSSSSPTAAAGAGCGTGTSTSSTPPAAPRNGFDTLDLTVDLVVAPDLTGGEWKEEDEYAHVRRLGIVSDTEHRAVDAARGEVLAMLTERSGVFAQAKRWAS